VQQRAVATTGTSDTSLNLLAVVLTMAILAILMKKLIFAWTPESMEF
jgi:predicted solute-binding protein